MGKGVAGQGGHVDMLRHEQRNVRRGSQLQTSSFWC